MVQDFLGDFLFVGLGGNPLPLALGLLLNIPDSAARTFYQTRHEFLSPCTQQFVYSAIGT